MSEQLSITTADGKFSCYVARPKQPGNYPVIVILQEIFGVNAGIRSIADSYAAKGYIAVAPDLFWRSEPNVMLSDANPEELTKAFALYTAYDKNKGVEDIIATITASRKLDGANGKVGVTGYCLGGLLTYLSATRSDADVFAAYYGGGTETFLNEAPQVKAPLLYHLAEEDEYINKEAQAAIKAAFKDSSSAQIYSYPGCNHAFARPDGSHANVSAAKLANERTDAFLARYLK